MDIRELTKCQFVNCETPTCGTSQSLDEFLKIYENQFSNGIPIYEMGGFKFLYLNEEKKDVFVLNENCDPVGFYIEDILMVGDQYQGLGLSAPLILLAIENRPAPSPDKPRKLTKAGSAALSNAWCVGNGRKCNPFWPPPAAKANPDACELPPPH